MKPVKITYIIDETIKHVISFAFIESRKGNQLCLITPSGNVTLEGGIAQIENVDEV